ncbi:cytochrome P450 [Brucella intermedia]|uniref:cytochrome P450 n=1 Tax=Brucella intermedia TaxID=94625 RepID=UPI0023619E14|nr:cytochrome P450 [Brucella intermedia]
MNVAVIPDFLSDAFFDNRSLIYRALREKFPFFRTEIGGVPCTVLSRYADVEDVLKHPLATIRPVPDPRSGNCISAELSRGNLDSQNVCNSSQLREIAARSFTSQAIVTMREWMEEIIERHLARLSDEKETDFIATFVSPLTAELAGRLVHLPVAEAEKVLRRSHELLATIYMPSPQVNAAVQPDAMAGLDLAEINDILRTLRNVPLPENDIIGLLMAADGKDNGISHSDLIAAITGFIATVYHTLRSTIANATLALLRHPDQKKRLITQPALARSAWSEALRFDGPVHFVHRYVSEPIVIGRTPIERGSLLVLAIQSANHDEIQFSNADRFVLSRSNNFYLNVEQGVHICWGTHVARLGGELLMKRLFQRFPDMQINEVHGVTAPTRNISFPIRERLNVRVR